MRSVFIVGFVLFGVSASNSIAGAYPKLTRNADAMTCPLALKIARVIYQSDVEDVSRSSNLPAEIGERAIWQGEDDFDKAVFDHRLEDARQVYTLKATDHDHKWLILQEAFNWRGDRYSLYATPPETLSAPLIDADWSSPIVFQTTAGHTFVVNPGAIWSFLPDWHVYSLDNEGGKDVCTIAFRPDVENATDLLPAPVKIWAQLLGSTLGTGENEGTAHYTAGIRTGVEKVWANVILRPWAAYSDTYNSHAEVDKGLTQWSSQTKSFAAVYAQIQTSYPAAEDAMAQYYQTHFDKPAEEARRMAKSALDIAYRSYFVFSKSPN